MRVHMYHHLTPEHNKRLVKAEFPKMDSKIRVAKPPVHLEWEQMFPIFMQ